MALMLMGRLVGFFGHGYFSVFGALLAELADAPEELLMPLVSSANVACGAHAASGRDRARGAGAAGARGSNRLARGYRIVQGDTIVRRLGCGPAGR